MRILRKAILVLAVAAAAILAQAQHLVWHYPKGEYTCLYGEIQVVATGPTIYYCGCNWWPGNAAGGYTGIQDAGNGRHLMIFSIWDTSSDLHPTTIEKDARTQANRFGGEGTGAHTHLDYDWPLGKTYRFFAIKKQAGANTLTRVYFFDEGLKKWVDEATISSPNGSFQSVKTFGGMLNSFLENWSGQDRGKPKLALYRLWVGTSPSDLKNVTECQGDGKWGVLDGTFYLAEGDDAELDKVIAAASKQKVERGGTSPLTVPEAFIPSNVLREIEKLAK